MKASIIINSYNHREYTIQAIEECLSQDYQGEYEIIIVDDGSTDGSIEVISNYSKRFPQKIKYYVMDRDDGVNVLHFRTSNVRKKGIELSSGEYLLLIDGDDLITRDKLRLQIDFLDNHKEYIACFTDMVWFWDNGIKIEYRFNYPTVLNSVFWGNIYMHFSCFVFRREVIHNFVPYNINDSIATFAILKTGKIYHLPFTTFLYRQRNDSLMHRIDPLENRVNEVLFFQFIRSSGGFHGSTLAKYKPRIYKVFKDRERLADDEFSKYMQFDDYLKNDYLKMMRDYNNSNIVSKAKFRFFFFESFFFWAWFRVLQKLISALHHKPLQTIEEISCKE